MKKLYSIFLNYYSNSHIEILNLIFKKKSENFIILLFSICALKNNNKIKDYTVKVLICN